MLMLENLSWTKLREEDFGAQANLLKGNGGKNKGGFRSQFRKPLAQRILETCRICHQKGHWKAECPQCNRAVGPANAAPSNTAFAGMVLDVPETDSLPDVVEELPREAFAFTLQKGPTILQT